MSEGSAKIYAICSVDGSRLYKSEHPKYNYVFSLMKNGRVDVDRFNAVFDDSLDLRYLDESVYCSHGGEMLGRHIFFKKNGDLQGTSAIINVTFDYALKEYEHRGNGIYYDPAVNSGEIELKDHVCLGSGGELLAIEVINQKSRDKANYSPVIFAY